MQSLLKKLHNFAQQDFGSASCAPPEMYFSDELFELEKTEIFAREWQCVGLAAEITKPGDYISVDLAGTPVIVLRQADGVGIKALSNVCLHRCARLVNGVGSLKRIVCPYHSWTYELDGGLVHTRHMQKSVGFEQTTLALPEVRCEVWQGFIYLSVNPDAPSLAQALSALDPVLSDYQLENYVHIGTYTECWPVNWKWFVENYLDAYHIFKVHKNTFGQYGNFEEDTQLCDGGDQYTYHLISGDTEFEFRGNPADAVAHPDNGSLQHKQRAQTVLAAVFPNHTMQVQPDLLWSVGVQADAVGQFTMRWSVAVAPEIMQDPDHGQGFAERTLEFLKAVNSEDKTVLSQCFPAAASPMAKPGSYSYLERNVFQFGRYIARRLAPNGS